ncbi:alpha/beta fold hydrolase [Bradyrhizobium archetypum]|jgi:polyhydroxyalkanoate synthase subunit PhaC|uniref:Alpha/beta fold hydrolase n=1 Tax=Bradyrhizobium archetypum TaxID=2721160 RepID=A0A7Y4H302_9BRAD|nr:alpha/beta fold hydrolase [Bradyrhizobium archetypum]NOJ46713.1 alpha/beta fold hydrolase [Bradyrhizobium archetypum]
MFPIFSISDAFRRSVGGLLEIAGYGPHEAAWDRLEHPAFRLRRYASLAANPLPVLIVPAPIKRAYIFDLLPDVSVVRRLIQAGFAVYLYEWPEEQDGKADLEASISSLRLAAEMIATEYRGRSILVGHSLGGTLAAIAASIEPHLVSKLVLVEAPLKFGVQTGALGPVVLSSPTVPPDPVPGSLLDLASVVAAPEEFVVGRYRDSFTSLLDPEALAIHLAVIRWSLDEFAPGGQLIRDVIQLLYREDRFARNELHVLGRSARSDALGKIPVAAIVDHASRVVPSSSVLGALKHPSIFPYEPEVGVALQHVGPLVGRQAHREIWPKLIDWMCGR